MYNPETFSLLVPQVSGEPLQISVKSVLDAENRIRDVAVVNAHKAPELLSTFNLAYLVGKDAIAKLRSMMVMAERAVQVRKSIVILDEVPKILAEKKLASARSPGGSEDLREAVLNQDRLYMEARDRVDQLEAMLELMEGKVKSIEMAYTSVKKILGDSNPWQSNNRNPLLSAGADLPQAVSPGVTVEVLPQKSVSPDSPRSRFGGAK